MKIYDEDQKTLNELKLHEKVWVDRYVRYVMRVSGGFLYVMIAADKGVCETFVPYNNELL